MFKCILEIQRKSPDVKWPHEDESIVPAFNEFVAYRAAFPGFQGIEVTSDDLTFKRVENWENMAAAAAFYEAPATQTVIANLGVNEYMDAHEMVKKASAEDNGVVL